MSAPFTNGTARVPGYVPGVGGMPGDTVPRHAYDQLPETLWRHPKNTKDPSVYVVRAGSEIAILPGDSYDGIDHGDLRSSTEQDLIGVVEAGNQHFGILRIRKGVRYGRPEPETHVVVRFDPTGREGYEPTVVARVPMAEGDDAGVEIGRGGALLDQTRFPGAAKDPDLSRSHFAVSVRRTEAGPRVVVTDIGSTNKTKISVPNMSDHGRAGDRRGRDILKNAWGGSKRWALRPEVAKDLRPSVMRPIPEASDEDAPVGDVEARPLYGMQGHDDTVTVSGREQFPTVSRRNMRLQYGIDATLLAAIDLNHEPGDPAGQRFILDRGETGHGDEFSLMEGGPLLANNERYVVVDAAFIDAAERARSAGDPGILHQFVAAHRESMRVVDSSASSTVHLAEGRVSLRFGWGTDAEVTVTDRNRMSAKSLEVVTGPRRPGAIERKIGAGALLDGVFIGK